MKDWRDSREYRIWRATVIRRDGHCLICGEIRGPHAHHVRHASYFQDKRFSPENGVTLCAMCHRQFHTNFKRSFREKCDEKDFENFTKLIEYIVLIVDSIRKSMQDIKNKK